MCWGSSIEGISIYYTLTTYFVWLNLTMFLIMSCLCMVLLSMKEQVKIMGRDKERVHMFLFNSHLRRFQLG